MENKQLTEGQALSLLALCVRANGGPIHIPMSLVLSVEGTLDYVLAAIKDDEIVLTCQPVATLN